MEKVEFPKGNVSSEQNGLFTIVGVRGRLESKDFEAVNMVFPFVAFFIDCATGNVVGALMTVVPTTHEQEASLDELVEIKSNIQKLKEIMEKTFHDHFETGLYTFKVSFTGSHC